MTSPLHSSSRWPLLLAFASVYIIWGSTYLAIRFVVETMPPFTTAGIRFVTAGALILAWAAARREAWPRAVHWRSAAIVGTLLLLGGNGSVVWSEQRIPSGLASLLVATTPLWMVLIDSLRPHGTWPRAPELVGVVVGFLGVLLLVQPGESVGAQPVPFISALVCLGAPLWWSLGSIYSRHAPLPASPFVATGLEMLCGGAALLLVGTCVGEWARLDLAAASPRSLVALAYLIVFGSIMGFTAYIYLLRHTTPARASSYAYVNPAVAVVLGWALASETISLRTLTGMIVILAGVVLTISFRAATPGEDLEVPIEAPGAEVDESARS